MTEAFRHAEASRATGRGLLAARNLTAGEFIIEREKPLIAVPLFPRVAVATATPASGSQVNNLPPILDSLEFRKTVCDGCLKSLESPGRTLARVLRSKQPDIDQVPFEIDLPRVFTDSGKCFTDERPVACDKGCGSWFCSVECRASAWNEFHCVECVGVGVDDKEFGNDYSRAVCTAKLFRLCADNGNHLPVQLLRCFSSSVADVLCGSKSLTSTSSTWRRLTELCSPAIAADDALRPGPCEPFAFNVVDRRFEIACYSEHAWRVLRSLHRFTYAMISRIVLISSPVLEAAEPVRESIKSMITWQFYQQILGSVRLNAIRCEPRSSFARYWDTVKAIPSSDEKAAVMLLLHPWLKLLPSKTNAVVGSEGSAIYTNVSALNHSCEPNVAVFYRENDAAAALVALRDITEGEELFISYLPSSLPVGVRQLWLQGQYSFSCECNLCRREAAALPFSAQQRYQMHVTEQKARSAPEPEVGIGATLTLQHDAIRQLWNIRGNVDIGVELRARIESLCKSVLAKKCTFDLDIRESRLSDAGEGVFARGEITQGAVVCLYGGVAYDKPPAGKLPDWGRENRYLLRLANETRIDGDTDEGGTAFTKCAEEGFLAASSRSCVFFPQPLCARECDEQKIWAHYCVASKINHPGAGDLANVAFVLVELVVGELLDETELPDDLPPLEDGNDSTTGIPRSLIPILDARSPDTCGKGLTYSCGVGVALREISDGQELFADYGLDLGSVELAKYPWYIPYVSPY